MNYATPTASSSKTGSEQLTIGFLVAGILFIAGYTLTRTLLMQPAPQSENAVVNSVIPHEATLWNADIDSF
ncbi:MAG: hypothetical protein AAF959_28330 [Cyanobacteria bacterium P01_D01_bin.56]